MSQVNINRKCFTARPGDCHLIRFLTWETPPSIVNTVRYSQYREDLGENCLANGIKIEGFYIHNNSVFLRILPWSSHKVCSLGWTFWDSKASSRNLTHSVPNLGPIILISLNLSLAPSFWFSEQGQRATACWWCGWSWPGPAVSSTSGSSSSMNGLITRWQYNSI